MVFRKMVEVVNHCHELGVMHRFALVLQHDRASNNSYCMLDTIADP